MPKIQSLKFHNSWYNLGETLPRSMHELFGSESVVHYQTRCCLKFFLLYGPMLTKTKKKWQSPKFEISPIFVQLWQRPSLEVCMNFWEWISYVISEEMSFEVFCLIWSHVNKKKRNFEKKNGLEILTCYLLVTCSFLVYSGTSSSRSLKAWIVGADTTEAGRLFHVLMTLLLKNLWRISVLECSLNNFRWWPQHTGVISDNGLGEM